jgi:hypothetical protein
MTTKEIFKTVLYLVFFISLLWIFSISPIYEMIGGNVFRSIVFGVSIFPLYWIVKLMLVLYCTSACMLEDSLGDVFWLEGMEQFCRKFAWKGHRDRREK